MRRKLSATERSTSILEMVSTVCAALAIAVNGRTVTASGAGVASEGTEDTEDTGERLGLQDRSDRRALALRDLRDLRVVTD